MNKPPCLVWLPMDHRLLGSSEKQMPFLVLGDKYARANKEAAFAQPVLFPWADASQILVKAFGKTCRARQNDRWNNSEHTLHAAAGSP